MMLCGHPTKYGYPALMCYAVVPEILAALRARIKDRGRFGHLTFDHPHYFRVPGIYSTSYMINAVEQH